MLFAILASSRMPQSHLENFQELLSVFGDRSLAEVDSAIREATADARLDGVHAAGILANSMKCPEAGAARRARGGPPKHAELN